MTKTASQNKTDSRASSSLWGKTVELLRLEQTLFALPIALSAAVWAAGGWPKLSTLGWIVLAMVGARTAGMSANRLIDASLDAVNPRTANRLLPSGRLGPSYVVLLMLVSLAVLVLAAHRLNPLCLALAPVAVGLLLLYSYLKRWTWGCHFGLGVVQACGPLGAWLGVTGEWALAPILLALGVFFWMAGFDVLYALADEEHDRKHGVCSIPARFGARRACALSRLCHLLAFSCWCCFTVSVSGGFAWGLGLGAVGALLIWEHVLVKPDNLVYLPMAFFRVNSLISVVLFLATLGENFL